VQAARALIDAAGAETPAERSGDAGGRPGLPRCPSSRQQHCHVCLGKRLGWSPARCGVRSVPVPARCRDVLFPRQREDARLQQLFSICSSICFQLFLGMVVATTACSTYEATQVSNFLVKWFRSL